MNIIEAIHDRALFAPWFRNRSTWAAWIAFLRALLALPMTNKERDIYARHTGRNLLPAERAREAWLVVAGTAARALFAR